MNAAVNTLYAEYLEHTGGDKAAAASLTLAAVLRDSPSEPAEPSKPDPADGRPLTVPEVAKHLRVSPDKVLGWIRSGALRAYNVTAQENGRPKYRVSREDLESFLLQHSAISRPAPRGRPVGRRKRRIPAVPPEGLPTL